MPRRLCVVIGPFIGWNGPPLPTRNGFGLATDGAERIAEVPGQAVEVAEDVAARAGVVAVPRGAERVVEEVPADLGRRRRRIVAQRHHRRSARATAPLALLTTEMVWSMRFIT